MGKEFFCSGFSCTMVEDHCVKAVKGNKGVKNFSGQNVVKRDENELLTAP